jgi:phenylacetate-CoA ligase
MDAHIVEQLRTLLLHAKQHVPYYQERWDHLPISFLEQCTLQELKKLPMLSKDDLREFGSTSLLQPQLSRGHFYQSSGSTGTPTRIYYSFAFHQMWFQFIERRVRQFAGVDLKNSRAMIGGRRVLPTAQARAPYYRYNLFERQYYFSAYHLSPSTIEDYLKPFFKGKIDYLTGYANSIYFLALLGSRRYQKGPQLKSVLTSSEKLTPEMRQVISDFFQCKVFDGWSGVEACGLVSECEHGHLHISPDVGILEIVDENGVEVAPGEVGEVICTGLYNFDQPLIRYRIGDRMRKSIKTACPCGRTLPMVDEIEGRIEDVVFGLDGRMMVRFHAIFYDIPLLRRGQIVQRSLEHIEVVYESDETLPQESLELMQNRLQSQLGAIQVSFQHTTSIPLTANGKFKAVISHVHHANH